MRLARFNGGKIGAVVDDQVHDVTDLVDADAGRADAGMVHLLSRWDHLRSAVAERVAASSHTSATDAVKLDCPIPNPTKVPAIPSNYRKHIAEMGSQLTVAERGVFLKAPSSLVGPNGIIQLPYSDRRTDHEAELGVVIGRRASHVSLDDALSYVAGYTCLFDVTVRGQEERSMRKSFDTFTPIGPWITLTDEIDDPDDLAIECHVNGETRQSSRTSEMIYSVPQLIELVSAVMTLEPGDVIATGTPQGVGPITDGDTLSMSIERIGRLELTVTAGDWTTCPFNS